MARPFVKYLETLITNGETPMALHVLLDFLDHKEQSLSESFAELITEEDTSLRKICMMQQSALSDNENELRLGLLEENEYDKAINRTSYTLLSLLSQLEPVEFDDEKALKNAIKVEYEHRNVEKNLGSSASVNKKKGMQQIVLILGAIALIALITWMFRDKFGSFSSPTESKRTRGDSLNLAKNYYEEAVNKRKSNDFTTCIKDCQDGIKWNPQSADLYNQLAECYLYNGEITSAFENAKKAYTFDPVDMSGFITSTLAQIYGEMDNTKLFYLYTEEALKRGLEVWDYETEVGFKKYKDEPQFKALMKKYNKQR